MLRVALILFFNAPPTPEIYTLSLHDALPIFMVLAQQGHAGSQPARTPSRRSERSEEHTSELQSHHDLVCRLLLEKKNGKLGLRQRDRLGMGASDPDNEGNKTFEQSFQIYADE